MKRYVAVLALLGCGPEEIDVAGSGPEAAQPIDPPAAAGLGAGGLWEAEVGKAIREEEHRFVPRGGSWHGVNLGEELRAELDPAGVVLGPRSGEGWEARLRAGGIGRPGRMTRLEAVAPAEGGCDGTGRAGATGECLRRIEYRREGVLEWWRNTDEGLEHGFDVAERPAGRGPLVVEVVFKGEVAARLHRGAVLFERTGENLLAYSRLAATDSEARALDAHIELEGRTVRLVVRDVGARYPVRIDPLATSPSWTAESNQTDAYFGWSVSTAGDVNGDGLDDVIVGACRYDNGQNNEGRAFVYHGSAAGLDAAAAWTDESDQASALFGYSVSTAGDVNGDGFDDVIVGARDYADGENNEGRAFVYHGSAAGLDAAAAWTAESDQANASFGYSVSTAGDVNGDGFDDVIVGAYGYGNGELAEGRAFVYHGSVGGLGAAAAWTAESDQVGARFGNSVSTAGDVNGDGFDDVIVGAYTYENGEADEGRAFVYHGSAAGLDAAAAWAVESDQASASFGYSVSTAGDVNGDGFDDVIVGAPWFYNGEFSQGRTFVYHGSEVGLDAAPAWTAEADPVGQQFGYSVSTAGDLDGDDFDEVVVGTLRTSAVFHGSAAGLDAAAAWTAESDQADALFGGSVSTAGDVNGDGVDDVIVGARYYDNGQSNEGRAFLYEGYRCGVDGEPCPGGLCRASLCDSGVCFVDGSSYDAGDEDPGNECQACVPASDRLGWTADADGTPCAGGACEAGSCAGRCFIGGVFWDAGVADPENECQSCVPAASTSSWTYDTDGTACAGGLCRAGLCDGGSCLVGGVWRAHNTEDPANECQACDVGSDRLDWTDDADGTVCVGGICRAGLCDGGSCLVDGAWHADSAEDPDNECQACDVVRTPLAWTADPDATVCDEGLCRAVQCEAVCRIGGVWSAAGDEREGNECEACAPTVDPFAWTPDADGTLCDGGLCRAGGCSGTSCFIDGIWHEEGEELIGNECQSCAPEVEPFDWTPDTDGTACADGLCRDGVCDGQSCLVMDEWRAAGEEDPVSECRACAPDQDRLAWTEDPEGTECDDGLGWTAEDVCSGGFCAGIECERPVGVDGLPFRAESGSTVGRHPDTPSYGAGCRGVDGAGPDVAYAFEARDGICYRVEVDPEAAFDAELAVTRACAVSVECVAASDDGTTGQAESAVFEAEGDGTVFVLVDGASVLDEGGFSIAIEQADCPNDGDDGGGGGDAGGDGGSRTDAGADGGNGEAGGCACRASGNSASGWLLLALAAIPLRRRHGAG